MKYGAFRYGQAKYGTFLGRVINETLHIVSAIGGKNIFKRRSESLNIADNTTFLSTITKFVSAIESLHIIDYTTAFLNGLRAGLWNKTKELSSSIWDKNANVDDTWTKQDSVVEEWTKQDAVTDGFIKTAVPTEDWDKVFNQ